MFLRALLALLANIGPNGLHSSCLHINCGIRVCSQNSDVFLRSCDAVYFSCAVPVGLQPSMRSGAKTTPEPLLRDKSAGQEFRSFAQAADPQRAQFEVFGSFGPIFWVREGFRLVQNCDWIHLDQVSGQTDHSRSSLDPFFFWGIFGPCMRPYLGPEYEAVSGARK